MTFKLKERILDAEEVARLCASIALDKKADNVIILDVSKLTSYTDYFVICSGLIERQVQAIAKKVEEALKEKNLHIYGIEGMLQGTWVLIDIGDVVFHCFTESARTYYNLENFWHDAPRLESK